MGIVVLSFLVSRAIYIFYFDLRFDTMPLHYFWQMVEPDLLKTDLLRTVYYLHFQPPLFPLFIGLVLKLFPSHYVEVFQITYLLMGLGVSITVFLLLIRMRVSQNISLFLTVMYTVSAGTAVYENFLMYTLPVTFLLCLTTFFIFKFAESRTLRNGILLFGVAATLVLTRSFFRFWWFLILILSFWSLFKSERMQIIKSSIIPFLVVFAFVLKQYLLFGFLGAGDTWIGQDLSWRIQGVISQEEKKELEASGIVPVWFFNMPHSPFDVYSKYFTVPHTGIAVLDRPLKSNGWVNMNYIGYIPQSKEYMAIFLRLVNKNPWLFLKTYRRVFPYFMPAGNAVFVAENNKGMNAPKTFFNLIICGSVGSYGWFLVMCMPVLIIYGIILLVRRGSSIRIDPFVITLAFILLNILLITVSSLTIAPSVGEYPRYRSKIDPLYLILLGLFLSAAIQMIDRKNKSLSVIKWLKVIYRRFSLSPNHRN